ncbi:MAG: hypothetical protein HY892_10915 [Deltaproteobacteria bacterium]|nr:hypothetical protein [Deltaproteobacteria bacterium]
MKKIVAGFLMGTMILGGALSVSANGPFFDRENRQQRRIHQGVRSGEITPGEYHALRHEQGAIERYRRRAWADGRLSAGEAGRLHQMQDRAGHHIFRAKHNAHWR